MIIQKWQSKPLQLLKKRGKEQIVAGENERMKPQAILGHAITAANTSILVGALAKILKQNGIETGQKRLFEWLRNNGYLIKQKVTTGICQLKRVWRWDFLKLKNLSILMGTDATELLVLQKLQEKDSNILSINF